MSGTRRTQTRLEGPSLSRASFLRLGLAGAAAAWLSPRLAQASGSAEDLSGRYRHSGGVSELDALERAVEEATSELNGLIRGIARSRIMSAVEPKAFLGFDFAPNRVTFLRPGMPILDAPLDRVTHWRNPERATIAVRCRLDGRTLRMRYLGDGGDTLCIYRFDPQRSRMQMHARIDHARLPTTLRYALTYRRDD